MDSRLVELASLLRHNGVRVSPAEVADAARAAILVGVSEKDSLRAAMRSAMVKRAGDVPIFDKLFDLYFSGMGAILDGIEKGLLKELEESGLLEEGALEMIARTLERLAGELSPLAQATLS